MIKVLVDLRSKGKTVTIACSTGIVSTHYGKLGGTTLHKWSGIGDEILWGKHLLNHGTLK
jgi:hypothetical protein